MKRTLSILLLFISAALQAQDRSQQAAATDANDALLQLPPDYRTPYQVPRTDDVKNTIDRILGRLSRSTPARLVNKTTRAIITDLSAVDQDTIIEPGRFRLTSDEWGVTYRGRLHVAAITADRRYRQ